MSEKQEFFELYWSWYEDYEPTVYYHPNKTPDQFDKDVKHMLFKYGQAYLDSEESWAGCNGWIDFIRDKMPELGYRKISPHSFGYFGGYILKENEDDGFIEKVGLDLFNKAIDHNNKIEKEISQL